VFATSLPGAAGCFPPAAPLGKTFPATQPVSGRVPASGPQCPFYMRYLFRSLADSHTMPQEISLPSHLELRRPVRAIVTFYMHLLFPPSASNCPASGSCCQPSHTLPFWGKLSRQPNPCPGQRQPTCRRRAQNTGKVFFLAAHFSRAVAPLPLLYRLTFPSLTFCHARFAAPARSCFPAQSSLGHRKKIAPRASSEDLRNSPLLLYG
jgi:hypothetical protein